MRDVGKEVSYKRVILLWVFWCYIKVSYFSKFVCYIELYMVFLGDEFVDYYLLDFFVIFLIVIVLKSFEKIYV